MKNHFTTVIFFFLVLATTKLMAQENCTVKVQALSGNYIGKCKKGQAHGKGIAVGIDKYEGSFKAGLPDGKGTYTWESGDSYSGDWVTGQRHGTGKMILKISGKDSIQEGVWAKDVFKGPKPKLPVVTFKTGVDRYDFRKDITDKNRVLVSLMQNGMRNASVTNLMLFASSGYETKLGESIGYDEITFPVVMKISYTTMNKLRTALVEVRFEFTIFEPGDWKVEINN